MLCMEDSFLSVNMRLIPLSGGQVRAIGTQFALPQVLLVPHVQGPAKGDELAEIQL